MPADETYSEIVLDVSDGVATVTLNRPERLNAYTPTMARELHEAFAVCDADDAVRAIVVTGAGRGFCAGADLARGGAAFDRTAEAEYERGGGGGAGVGSREPGGPGRRAARDGSRPGVGDRPGHRAGLGGDHQVDALAHAGGARSRARRRPRRAGLLVERDPARRPGGRAG